MIKLLLIIGGVALVIFVILIAPCAFIWAVNTLFGLTIKYTIKNLFAAFVLLVLVNAGKDYAGKSK